MIDATRSAAGRQSYETLSEQSARKPVQSSNQTYAARQPPPAIATDQANTASRSTAAYDVRIEELVRRYNEQLKEVPYEQKRESQLARTPAHYARYASHYGPGRPTAQSVADEYLDYYMTPKRPSPISRTGPMHISAEERDPRLMPSRTGNLSTARLPPSRSHLYHPHYAPNPAHSNRLIARGSVMPMTRLSASERDHYMVYNAQPRSSSPARVYDSLDPQYWRRGRAFARQLPSDGITDQAIQEQRKDETSAVASSMRMAQPTPSAKPAEVIDLVDENDAVDIALRTSARLPRFSRQETLTDSDRILDRGRPTSRAPSPHTATSDPAQAAAKYTTRSLNSQGSPIISNGQVQSSQDDMPVNQQEQPATTNTSNSVSSITHNRNIRNTSPALSTHTTRHSSALEATDPTSVEEDKSNSGKDEGASEVDEHPISPRRTRSGSRVPTSLSVKRKVSGAPASSEEYVRPDDEELPPRAKRRKFGKLPLRCDEDGESLNMLSGTASERSLSP